MKIYDNEMSDAAKGEIEQSGENFLFAENVPFEKRLSIGYKLSLKDSSTTNVTSPVKP